MFNAFVGLGTILLAKYFLALNDVAANALGYGVGLSLSFVLNRTWTFAYNVAILGPLVRFITTFLIAYGLNLVTVLLLIRSGLDSYLAQILGAIPYTTSFFLLCRYMVFPVSVGREKT